MNQNNYMRLTILTIMLSMFLNLGHTEEIKKEEESIENESQRIVIDTLSFSIENLDYVLQHYGVKHRQIVIAQFALETGWGKSYSFRVRNNLFGLYNSRKHSYFEFKHWTESVKGYRDLVQYKYKGGDYYEFLKKLPYAEDPKYINKIKRITYDIQ
jgi:flagellum-specific peptidoglycan hydrolase FlgJ